MKRMKINSKTAKLITQISKEQIFLRLFAFHSRIIVEEKVSAFD